MSGLRTISACAAVTFLAACGAPEPDTGLTIDGIVTISDGDYLASTYRDSTLAPADAHYRDLLSTIRIRNGEAEIRHAEVSNSVTSAPEVLALAPDGGTAFVTERLRQREPGDTRATDLAPGDRLFALALPESGEPTLIDTATIATTPEALAVHPAGSHVAVVANPPEASVLQLVPWDGTEFGDPARYDLAALGITGELDSPRGGVLATNVQWHPSGRALAVNITTQDRVAFFRVDITPSGAPQVRPWGAPVPTGTDPFVGRFTPDGRHYVTSDWGRNLHTTDLAERLPSTRSTVGVIRLADLDSPDGHRSLTPAESDISAEGIAISPDGRHIATVNMRGTVFPPGTPGQAESATVTLLRLDPDTGTLTKIGDYPLDGILPEGGSFDPSGTYFLATVFEARTPDTPGAGLQIFRVGPDENPGLTPIHRVPLPHGVHHVAVG
ncbi:lactonase family protein [Nocardia rhizosphaerae]|uniref:Lactonase family protein n=1 Tax=Nocardia rhizosphaerae TaxID=1691571 RepID=A0ABV8L5V3_9NOCA